MSQPAAFRTTNLYLAAFLRFRGGVIGAMERADHRTVFIFDPGLDFEGLERLFWTDSTVTGFVGAIRDVKAMVHRV